MGQKLVVNQDEYVFEDFETAVFILEEEFGYEGKSWDIVVFSGNLYVLCDFLHDNGLDTEIQEK